MTWQQWTLVVYLVINTAVVFARVGTVRTRKEAIWAPIEIAVLIALVVSI